MYWDELLKTIDERNVKLACVATTGLGDDDEVIAMTIISPEVDGSIRRTFIRRIDDRDKVIKSQEIHKITPERDQGGMTDEAFKEAINNELNGSVFFTYNPGFQLKFLNRINIVPDGMYNLPLFLKGAESKIMLFEEDVESLMALQEHLAKTMGGCTSMAKLAKQRGYEPTLTELPVEFFCRALLGFWKSLASLPAFVQGKLL